MHCRRPIFFLLLLATAALSLPAQAGTTTNTVSELPQWVKDLRRWEIVTFGAFPFAMFTTTFAMDMKRWSDANGMDFSDVGRRYAPWPLKSAGAEAMKWQEQELTITIAAGLSVAIAVTDFIIVQVKRSKARKKAEALPAGSSIIVRTPLASDEPESNVQPEDGPDDIGHSDEADSIPPDLPIVP
jgi:hypothetical protein